MRIAIDAMGGDNAPDDIIAGVLESVESLSEADELILVGPREVIEGQVPKRVLGKGMLSIADAPDVIGMDDPPVESLRKKPRSSIGMLAKLAKHGQADAVISAGNTGACVAAFQMRMRTLPGVIRPGICAVIPTFEGPVTVCDVGANISCKPRNIFEYAVMASIYSRHIIGIENPRVGILSIGSEDAKGNEIVKKARELLKADDGINFIGNVEGRDIFRGVCDVAVCEGFVGNVVLKIAEGVVDTVFRAIKHELMAEKLRLAMKFKPVMMRIYRKYDYNEYGGALLLGVNGTAVICHGSSKARTIKNAVMASRAFCQQKINDKIIEYLSTTQNSDDAEDGTTEHIAIGIRDGQSQ
jgi:glycerol-3-phosphate acyltransferase PlsX